MRVVIAPDSFGGTLSATEAAAAIATGWRRIAPRDEVRQVPLADGGTGFVDVLHAALGGELRALVVTGPLRRPDVTARWLRVERDGRVTGYVEAAQACGLHLVGRPGPHAARRATSHGVGQLIAAARECERVVVGLGGSACTDGGAGALAALGATPLDAERRELPDGGAELTRCADLGTVPGLPWAELMVAVDVDNPLLGRYGAAAVFGPQKGADPAAVADLEAGLSRWVAVLGRATGHDPATLAAVPGGGAAGGLGAALLALGGRRVSGAGLVRELSGLDAALEACDLVLTGEGRFDWQSLRGKLVSAVAQAAAERGLPCVVLAGQVSVGRREAAAVGVAEAHSVAERVGIETALADPAGTLADLAGAVARQWSAVP